MRWYEYKMETDDLYAPDDLKAKLLAMTDQLTEEEKAQPMMKTDAPVPAQSAPVQPKKKLIRFPAKRVGALAACLAVCVVGYGAFATGQIGLGAKSSGPAVYYSADSTAAVMAAGGADRAAVDSPMAAGYSLNTTAPLFIRRTTRQQRPTAPTTQRSSTPRTSAWKARTTTQPALRWMLLLLKRAAIWNPAVNTRMPVTAAVSA